MRRPDHGEDAKNLSLISVSGLVAVIVTAALLYANNTMDRPPVWVPTPTPTRMAEPPADMGPVSGSPRLFGTVVTRWGESYTGFIRWDRNEGSWADVLDANKLRPGRTTPQSGIRFGHVYRIEPQGSDRALFTLKSGSQVTMEARATDLGSGLRALWVTPPGSASEELEWSDLASVEFQAAPESAELQDARLFGTLTTRTGQEFTGYIGWDVDEIFTSDILDGEADGVDYDLPFGNIVSIERDGPNGARVTLNDGRTMVLRGTNDVNSDIGGVSVSDPALGEVKMDWRTFQSVRFHREGAEPGRGFFDGGHTLRGTVLTESGQELTGEIQWDADEALSWEMLNGEMDGVEFQVEFSNIASIEKVGRGSLVTLKDGRVFELSGSNDVDAGNRGIVVQTADGTIEVDWSSFKALRFES